MTDKPILFSAPMIRALLEGRKTQTRRLLKPQPHSPESVVSYCVSANKWMSCEPSPLTGGTRQMDPWRTLPYAVGDRLWVREAWCLDAQMDHRMPLQVSPLEPRGYPANNWVIEPSCMMIRAGRLRNARFMPRWASRITLTVTDVRVQQIRDMSDEDAIAEGIEMLRLDDEQGWKNYEPHWLNRTWERPVVSFATLWNSIHGLGEFAKNPWVAAYTFTVQHGNIDQLEAAA